MQLYFVEARGGRVGFEGDEMKRWSNNFARIVLLVAIANLAYFGVEFTFATVAKSVSLFADSIDFLEDAAVNFLIFFALSWTISKRALVGKILAGVIFIPCLAAIVAGIYKLVNGDVPAAAEMTLVGFGALLVNATCALMLARFRQHGGSLSKAAFLSARNDVLANIAIIIAGLLTARAHSFWPDFIVGAGIAVMNFDAAKQVWRAATAEALTIEPKA